MAATRSAPRRDPRRVRIIDEEALAENARVVGAATARDAPALRRRLPVRRRRPRPRPLPRASSSCEDKKTKEPLSRSATRRIFDECVRRGLLTMAYAPSFRIQPPLTIDRATAQNGVAILREVFDLCKAGGFWKERMMRRSAPTCARSVRTWTHCHAARSSAWPLYVVVVRREIRWEFIALIFVVLGVAFFGPRTRKLYVGLFPLALVAIVYDAMRFVKYVGISAARIHVCDLRDDELALFGVGSGSARDDAGGLLPRSPLGPCSTSTAPSPTGRSSSSR